MAFRAFIAAEVPLGPEALRAWDEVKGTGADLKVVDPGITHVTLKFLGDTDEGLVEAIAEAMEAAVAGKAPFQVTLKGMGVFPKPSHIRVVWLGMEGAELMVDIARELDRGISKLGFPKEKKVFKPHLTVARTRSPRGLAPVAELVKDNPDTPYGKFTVDRIILKKSDLTPKGPIYTDVRVAELKG